MATPSAFGVVKINGSYRSETDVYGKIAILGTLATITLLIIAAVAAGNKFRGSNTVLAGTLIGGNVVYLSAYYVIPRLLGIKRNYANGMHLKSEQPHVLKQLSLITYAVEIAALVGICVLGTMAIKGYIVNQKIIGGIALGIFGGAFFVTTSSVCYLQKHGLIKIDRKAQKEAEMKDAGDLNSFQGTEQQRLQQLIQKKTNSQ